MGNLAKIVEETRKRLERQQEQKSNIKESAYDKWVAGEIGNFGSFDTALLKLYQMADGTNQQKLANAFPEWFK